MCFIMLDLDNFIYFVFIIFNWWLEEDNHLLSEENLELFHDMSTRFSFVSFSGALLLRFYFYWFYN